MPQRDPDAAGTGLCLRLPESATRLCCTWGGVGFFATGRVASTPKPRQDWTNRYGAIVESVRLIEPAISLETIRRRIPDLTWAVYPRSITTPRPPVAGKIRSLITLRRRTGLPDLSDAALAESSIDELRAVAISRAVDSAPARAYTRMYRVRSQAIRLYVLRRANGTCEWCQSHAPFMRPDGSPYLEPHHVTRPG
jgi:hypothetical protein